MKTPALILLFPFAVFLTETVSFPQAIDKSCKKMSCMKMKEPMKCHGKKDNSQAPSGKCNKTADCSFCPVCSTFTFLPQYEWSVKWFSSGKNYWLVNTGYISSYVPPVWKPPNS